MSVKTGSAHADAPAMLVTMLTTARDITLRHARDLALLAAVLSIPAALLAFGTMDHAPGMVRLLLTALLSTVAVAAVGVLAGDAPWREREQAEAARVIGVAMGSAVAVGSALGALLLGMWLIERISTVAALLLVVVGIGLAPLCAWMVPLAAIDAVHDERLWSASRLRIVQSGGFGTRWLMSVVASAACGVIAIPGMLVALCAHAVAPLLAPLIDGASIAIVLTAAGVLAVAQWRTLWSSHSQSDAPAADAHHAHGAIAARVAPGQAWEHWLTVLDDVRGTDLHIAVAGGGAVQVAIADATGVWRLGPHLVQGEVRLPLTGLSGPVFVRLDAAVMHHADVRLQLVAAVSSLQPRRAS